MRWILKSLAQGLFSVLPGGNRLNRAFQGDVAARLIPGHLHHLDELYTIITNDMHIGMEIGTGWCPTLPLGLTTKGIEVHTYDRIRHVKPLALAASKAAVGGNWGMVHYHAPSDATATDLCDDSIDLHFSIAVLEHIPSEIIPSLFKEAYRVLRPGGLLYHEIDLRDHYAEFDRTISTVNFLKFDDLAWRLLGNNNIHFQNRLRASDFLTIFQESGFELLDVRAQTDKNGVEALRNMRVADRFKCYDFADLTTSILTITARKT